MKIFSLFPYFYPEVGGAENYAYNITKRLAKKGCDTTILCSSRSKINKEETIDRIKIIRQRPNFVISNTPIKLNLYFTTLKLLKKIDFDIVTAYTPVPFYADIGAIVSKRYKIPFVLTYHNDIVKDTFPINLIANIYNHTFGKLTIKFSKLIITSSPYCYNESNFLKYFKDKVIWIPPGVDIEKYDVGNSFKLHDTYGLSHSSKIVLFVGQLSKAHVHKGVVYLIKSFKKVLREVKNVYLVIIGTGNMIPKYKKMCEELGILDRVIFTGFVDETKLIKSYKSSNIVILPSTTIAEGFGMVLIEGNACGRPVIGTKVGGIQYIIRNGETGLLVPPKDSKALADAIIRLLQDEELSKKMGENGRRLVEEKYTWKKVAEITEKVYEELL